MRNNPKTKKSRGPGPGGENCPNCLLKYYYVLFQQTIWDISVQLVCSGADVCSMPEGSRRQDLLETFKVRCAAKPRTARTRINILLMCCKCGQTVRNATKRLSS